MQTRWRVSFEAAAPSSTSPAPPCDHLFDKSIPFQIPKYAGTPEGVIHGFGSFFNFTSSNFTTNSGRQTGVMTIEDGSASFDSCIFNSNQGAQVGTHLCF